MPLEDLPFKPGFVSDDTDRDVGKIGYWKDGDKVRFLHGLPQMMGGWIADNISTSMAGRARGAVDWLSLRDERIIAFGTHLKLYVWIGGSFYDITPIRASSTINADPFSMTNTSTTVTVTDTAHGATDGAYVTFSGAAAAGGITISGEYQLTYVDANTYTITHSAAATSTTTGGGASVVAAYQINPGQEDSLVQYGWGVGTWGAETWGTARSISTTVAAARTWALDLWGEDLIACHFDGSIYVWDSSGGTGTRATLISGAPTDNKSAFVSQQARHLVALGAGSDPLQIKWSTSEDYTVWTATTTNTAGDKRVDKGSQLMRALQFKNIHLIFTDAAVYAMQYVGPPYTFSVEPVGSTGGLAGPNAVVEYSGVCYWMGTENFYMYDGTVRPIPCSVYETVFRDYNADQAFKVWAGANSRFDEIWWMYCSADSDEIDRYVVFNAVEKHWVFGTLARTLYVGDSDIINNPYAVSSTGYLYYHDFGTSADGAAIDAYVVSGDVEIPKAGERMMHVDKVVPDFKRLTDVAYITLTAKKYPQDSESQTSSALAVSSTTKFVNPRVRGRQMSVRVESTSITADWRLGMLRIGVKPHGKR